MVFTSFWLYFERSDSMYALTIDKNWTN